MTSEHSNEQSAAASPVVPTVLPNGKPGWLITRYEEARRALSDPRLSSDTSKMGDQAPLGDLPESATTAIASDMLNTDPPAHTRMRKLVAPTFTAKRIVQFRANIEQIVAELIDAFGERKTVDLLEEYTAPLATRALGELIGIPAADCADIRCWSEAFLTQFMTGSEAMIAATKALSDYCCELVERKRRAPSDDLISRLIAARDGEDRLSDKELSSIVFILLIAGQAAAAQLMAKGIRLLLTNPGQLGRLRADPALLPSAIQEFLRIEPPLVITTFRMAKEPIDIAGTRIGKGDIVICSLLSANHDEARFPDARTLDIGRRDNQHLSFGHGIHRCLGSVLAEAEAQVAIGTLLNRFDTMRLAVPADELQWLDLGIMNRLMALPVELNQPVHA
jgi:cytochrome P450